jgi:hypothetical protein
VPGQTVYCFLKVMLACVSTSKCLTQTYPVPVVGPFIGRAASNVDLLSLDHLIAIVGNPFQACDLLEVAVPCSRIINGFEAVHALVTELCTFINGGDSGRHRYCRTSEVCSWTYSVSDALGTGKDCVGAGASIKGNSRLEKNGCRKHCEEGLGLHPGCQDRVQCLEKLPGTGRRRTI